MNPKHFAKKPVMGIVRGICDSDVEPLVEAVVSAGLETMEITMNTDRAESLIKKAQKVSRGRLTIGAGTVLDLSNLKSALRAGATFIVTPVLVPDVTAYCVKSKIPVFPGALTPTEIYAAWNAGASMVKVFPSGFFGPGYFTEIKGPFADIKLLACGGVRPENMGEYFKAGADAVSFGSSVFRKDLFVKKDYATISALVRIFIENIV